MDVFLIDYEQGELTNYTPLGGNIDVDRYKFCILDAQNSKVKEILGDTLYNKIETDYTNNDLAGNYLTLYNEFIKWIVIHQSAVEYLTIGSLQVSNGGIYEHTPANGQPADTAKIKLMIDAQRLKVEMYVERLQRWLFRVYPPEYIWHYENIVNPSFKSGSGLNFDFVGSRTSTARIWDERNDSGMLH